MTISSENRKAGPYTGTGITGPFPFSFKVFSASDVLVVRTDLSNVESTLALTTDYTVSLNADQNANPGGSVTLISALPSGYLVTLTSQVDYKQATDLTNQGGFYPSVITNALDKLTILIQQLRLKIGRSLSLPLSASSSVSTELPLPQSSTVIGWNAEADALQNYDATDFASTVQFSNWQYNTFTGDGTTINFTLSGNPVTSANTDVSIGGVTQVPGTDYAILGKVISFTVAPPNLSKILVRYGQAAQQMVNALATEYYTATAGQTLFPLSTSYVIGHGGVAVYLNGSRLTPSEDYTETSTTSITLTSGATAGDRLLVVIGNEANDSTVAASAVTATIQAGIATTQAGISTAASITATTQASLATTARAGAEAARDAANAVGKVFANTTLGIAGTTSGQSFSVLSTDLLDLIVYTNASGTATELFRFRTKAFLDSLGFDTTYSTRTGYAAAWLDQSNRLALGITTAGKVVLGNGVNVSDALSSLVSIVVDDTRYNRSGYLWAWEDSAGKVAGGLDSAGNLISKGVNITQLSGSLSSTANAVKWVTPSGFYASGDSLTAGAGGTPYPTQLGTLLGVTVQNAGVGGQTSTQIAGRFGGVVPLWTISGNTIPTSGGVTVTAQSSTLHNNQGPGTIYGTLNGVYGAFTFDNVSTYTFTRSVAGSAVYVDPQTPFIVDMTDLRDFKTVIIWQGRNNVNDPTQIKKDIAATIDFIKTQDKRFIVLSVLNTNTETSGTSNYNTIVALNDELKALYPRNYIDIRKILVRSYNSGIPQDVTDFGNDVPPSSLRSDAIHLNTAGYGIVANAVYNLLTLKGWTS